MVNINQYPQLKLIAGHLPQVTQLGEQEVFTLHERNWRFIDEQTLTETEKQFIQMLAEEYGRGLLNV